MQIATIIGVIIAKDGPKSIISKKGGHERFLLALTVRDSESGFINVTCWESEEYIQGLTASVTYGSVVEIKQAQIQTKPKNESDDKFKPWTPSPYQMNLSDNQGSITLYNGLDASSFTKLMHFPTKAYNDFYTLEDIQANVMRLQGEHVNLLAAVKKVWPVRELVTKTGRKTLKADIVLCDETCSAFNLTLWGCCVSLIDNWIPMETVIFAADVRISFNEYRSTMVANTDSKTVLTTSPATPEATSLQEFIRTQDLLEHNDNDGISTYNQDSKDPEIETITNVLTVRQIKYLQTSVAEGTNQTEYAVVYTFRSNFDIDRDDATVFQQICSKCRKPIIDDGGICGNQDCVGADLTYDDSNNFDFRLSISLTDHTGSLEFCNVPSHLVEEVIGCKAKEFKTLSSLEKTDIKWRYLFERVKAVLKIRKRKDDRCYTQVIVLHRTTPDQVLEGFAEV
ncbi:meiosis-specific with OB domain-containing protein-like [Physella acuta]|uniref:meiosis-specific with OB domain-containing protein-like n=1 Tax=Physella acuta TaxID=109671 RepID=UPI0027DB396C|nr:meiosis-specific with OB domain-containing protein-like [Physella acuta]